MTRLDPLPRRWSYWAGGGLLLALFGWSAFVRGVRVPLLGWIDLFVHEAGHVLALPLPDLGEAVMGNGLQVLMPLAFAVAFLVQQRDLLGAAVSLGWMATSLQDTSVYVADAPFQRLPLIGGMHDWAYVLGELDLLHLAAPLARLVWFAGLAVWLLAVGLVVAGPWLDGAVRAGRWPAWPPWRLPATAMGIPADDAARDVPREPDPRIRVHW